PQSGFHEQVSDSRKGVRHRGIETAKHTSVSDILRESDTCQRVPGHSAIVADVLRSAILLDRFNTAVPRGLGAVHLAVADNLVVGGAKGEIELAVRSRGRVVARRIAA